MPLPLIAGGMKRCFCLTFVCLSHILGLIREQRGLGRLTSHVTRTPLSRSVKRSRSPGRFTQRGLNA